MPIWNKEFFRGLTENIIGRAKLVRSSLFASSEVEQKEKKEKKAKPVLAKPSSNSKKAKKRKKS